MKKYYIIICICILLLYLVIYDMLDVNYISQIDSPITSKTGNSLELINSAGQVIIPHLNVRGTIIKMEEDSVVIALSEESKSFLKTREVVLNEDDVIKEKLSLDDDVFLKFNQIIINDNILLFNSINIYKYVANIEKTYVRKSSFIVPNDFGGFIKNKGTEFIYNNHKYFELNEDISEDGKIYFEDIYDGTLLIEEYKNLLIPRRWFNMVNPQETYFEIIVDIYKNKASK